VTLAETLERMGVAGDPAALAGFLDALYTWNEQKNLTRVPREEAAVRHVADSLLILDLIPNGAEVVDLGTGPGFPAWPIAWARPDTRVTAVDSNGKMLDFLRSQPLPNLTVVQVRAEEWGVREAFDVATGRALAPMAAQLELSAPLVRVGGIVAPLRSSSEEFAAYPALGLELESVLERTLPDGSAARRIPVYRKARKTPGKYPRRWAEMKKNPLTP